jgi:hypothetical protein
MSEDEDDGDVDEDDTVRMPGRVEADGYTIVGGAGRCKACIRDGTQCSINLEVIEGWRGLAGAGHVYHKVPAGGSCKQCNLVRKKVCELPATEEMRAKIVRAKSSSKGKGRAPSVGPAESSGKGKRKMREDVEVVIPARKKTRTAEREMSQGEFYSSVVRHLDAWERREAESSRRAQEREDKFDRDVRTALLLLTVANRTLLRLEQQGDGGKKRSLAEEFAKAEAEAGVAPAEEPREVEILDLTTTEDEATGTGTGSVADGEMAVEMGGGIGLVGGSGVGSSGVGESGEGSGVGRFGSRGFGRGGRKWR